MEQIFQCLHFFTFYFGWEGDFFFITGFLFFWWGGDDAFLSFFLLGFSCYWGEDGDAFVFLEVAHVARDHQTPSKLIFWCPIPQCLLV